LAMVFFFLAAAVAFLIFFLAACRCFAVAILSSYTGVNFFPAKAPPRKSGLLRHYIPTLVPLRLLVQCGQPSLES
jgi:hypothetical protein